MIALASVPASSLSLVSSFIAFLGISARNGLSAVPLSAGDACTYSANGDHWLYLGTRLLDNGGQVAVQVDGSTPATLNLLKAAEDVLVRLPVAALPGQVQHAVTVTHTGAPGRVVYFDFLEIAYARATLPEHTSE